jgi:helix-turn-helix protein
MTANGFGGVKERLDIAKQELAFLSKSDKAWIFGETALSLQARATLSDMMRGDFSNLSERKLMDCLTRLGYDIEIKVKPASKSVGHLMLAIA